MALTGGTSTELIDALESVASEIGGDACQIICEAKALICANPVLVTQCQRITDLADEYDCDCPGGS